MHNPHSPQFINPHAPQRPNPHMPNQNFHMMPRPQGQINQMVAPQQRRTYSNTNDRSTQAMQPTFNNTTNHPVQPTTAVNTNMNANLRKAEIEEKLKAFPQKMNTNMITRNSYDKTQEASFSEMARNGIMPECLYCDKKFLRAGAIRVHLRSHSGIRPYKCALCNYRHWYPTPVLTTHFVNVHGRKGQPTDVVTLQEEEDKMKEKVEQEANEVRKNQRDVHEGKPKKAKKIPEREGGAVFHEYYLGKYDDPQFKDSSENTKDEDDNTKKPALSAKLSEAYHNDKSSSNPGGNRNTDLNSNNVVQSANHDYNEPANIPSELKQLPIDKLLNNDF